MLKCCYRRQCCKGGVEAMLQKTMLQKQCWSDGTEDVAEVVLQKMLIQKIISASMANKCTSTFFFFASFHSCSSFLFLLKCRRWGRTKRLIFIYLFLFSYVANDDEPPWLIIIFFFSSCVADDGEPIGLSSFLRFFSSSVINDGEPPWLVIISLFFFSRLADDGEPGGSQLVVISWFFLKFELTRYITAWCIITVPSCTWGCHPGWVHWLHHHLMHHYCTLLYMGMLPPPNKCKGKEEKGMRYATFG